jgi:hypothetical protein
MVTGDDNRNTVKENAGQSHSHVCTISPASWQVSQKTEEVRAQLGLTAKGVAILLSRLDAASAAAYTERIRNVTKTVETVTIICSRTFLFLRPISEITFVAPSKNRRMQRTPAAKKETSMMTSEQPSQIDPYPANLKPSDNASAADVTSILMMQVGAYMFGLQGLSSSKFGFTSIAANFDQKDEPEGKVKTKRMKKKLQPTFERVIRVNGHTNDVGRIQNSDANNNNAGQKLDPAASKLLPLHDKLHHPLYNLITVRTAAL